MRQLLSPLLESLGNYIGIIVATYRLNGVTSMKELRRYEEVLKKANRGSIFHRIWLAAWYN